MVDVEEGQVIAVNMGKSHFCLIRGLLCICGSDEALGNWNRIKKGTRQNILIRLKEHQI